MHGAVLVSEQMAYTAHYMRSALPEHALRQAASVDVAEQLGFAGFLDAHAAQERPETVEEEPSPDEAARKRLMQMMQKYDGAPPRQYQPPPTSGLSLAELSIEPNTLEETVLQPVLQRVVVFCTVFRCVSGAAGLRFRKRFRANSGPTTDSERI